MDRGAWLDTVHGVTGIRQDLMTKLPPQTSYVKNLISTVTVFGD